MSVLLYISQIRKLTSRDFRWFVLIERFGSVALTEPRRLRAGICSQVRRAPVYAMFEERVCTTGWSERKAHREEWLEIRGEEQFGADIAYVLGLVDATVSIHFRDKRLIPVPTVCNCQPPSQSASAEGNHLARSHGVFLTEVGIWRPDLFTSTQNGSETSTCLQRSWEIP